MTAATPPVLYISADTSDLTTRYIADIAGQKPGRSGGRVNPELYSEDLW